MSGTEQKWNKPCTRDWNCWTMFLYHLFLCAVTVDHCEHSEWFEKLEELVTTPLRLPSQQIITVALDYVVQTIQEEKEIFCGTINCFLLGEDGFLFNLCILVSLWSHITVFRLKVLFISADKIFWKITNLLQRGSYLFVLCSSRFPRSLQGC